MKAGLLVFPGTNCDRDLDQVLTQEFRIQTEFLWHTDSFEVEHDIYFLPGGFSYGDYLRSGALAASAASVRSLKKAARENRTIVGICNGFQILTESHLLPGALIKNNTLKHQCKWVDLRGEGVFQDTPNQYALPVSNSEGNYLCSQDDLKHLEDSDCILFRYIENPNGSVGDIAGIKSKKGKIFGLMPHPERAMRFQLDKKASERKPGRYFFEKILSVV